MLLYLMVGRSGKACLSPPAIFSNANASFYTGYQGLNNRLMVNNGGQFYGSNMIVGQSGYTGNGIDVRSGGLLDANQYTVFAGNYITNSGGIYQFSSHGYAAQSSR